MALPPEARRPKTKKKKYVRPAPKSQPGPYRDTERKAVEQHKRTPAYRGAIKQAYRSRPLADRQERIEQVAAKPPSARSREDRAVLDTHRRREARDQKLLESRAYTDRARKIVEGFKRTPSYTEALAEARRSRPKPKDENPAHVDALLAAAGIKPADWLSKAVGLPSLSAGTFKSAVAVGEAAYRDPAGVPIKSGKQLLTSLPGIPGELYNAVTDPIGTGEEFVEGLVERSEQPYAQRVKTIRKEGGLAYAGDATMFLGAGSGLAGKLLRTKRHAAVRTSGGTATQPNQRTGATRAAVLNAVDKRSAAKAERALQEAEAGGQPVDALTRQVAEANRAAGQVVEVVGRRAGKAQVKSVARERGRGVHRLKAEQGRRIAQATKSINRLSKAERRSLYYAATFGIRSADQARELLPELATAIREVRARDGVQVTGSLKRSDMLPDIAAILAKPDEHFTANLSQVVEELRPDSMRAGREDPSLDTRMRLVRRRAPQAELLGVARREDETDAAYVKRVRAVAESRGLDTPIYFRSERYAAEPLSADFAAGGRRAMAADQRYEGTNLRQGLQETSPDQYLRGLARNTKRKHNWNLVADILDANALREFAPPGGSTLAALRERLVKAGVDLNSVAFFDAGAYRALAQHRDRGSEDERFVGPEEFEADQVRAALIGSVARGDGRSSTGQPLGDALHQTRRWSVVPVKVLRELEDQMQPSSALGRSLDISKGKASRMMLLFGNVPWLGFQVVGSAGAAVAATAGRALNPANWVGAARWWRELTPDQRDRVGSMFGLDATGADAKQLKLGASTNRDFVNAYRAFKAHPAFHTGTPAVRIGRDGVSVEKRGGLTLSEMNPLERMAMLDRGQNNVFRILSGYTLAKREAIQRMGESMGHAERTQARIMSIFTKPPREQLRALADDPQLLERHAEAVADWMGDYTTLTARERKVVNRLVMFMPFLRYSLRLAFYTLPVKHPAVAAILAEMGAMRAEELRELLGSDDLFWNVGKIYFTDDGKLKSVDFSKANPALNSLHAAASAAVDQDNLGQLAGMLPPYAGWAFDQILGESLYAGRGLRLQSRAPAYGEKVPVATPARLRVLANDVLSIFAPYRALAKLERNPAMGFAEDDRLAGTQGDDSLIFAPRPTRYRSDDSISRLRAAEYARQDRFEERNESVLRTLLPMIPEPSRDVNSAKIKATIKRIEARKAKTGKRRKAYGASSGSGYFGASK